MIFARLHWDQSILVIGKNIRAGGADCGGLWGSFCGLHRADVFSDRK
jgi:hypothetical protein